jgi:hypothetical protein
MTDDWVVEASSQQLGADGAVLAAASSEKLQPAAVGNRQQLQAASSRKQLAMCSWCTTWCRSFRAI